MENQRKEHPTAPAAITAIEIAILLMENAYANFGEREEKIFFSLSSLVEREKKRINLYSSK